MKYECYGHFSLSRSQEQCGSCAMREFCRSAADLPLLCDTMGSYNESYQDEVTRELHAESDSMRRTKLRGEVLRYSRNDLLEVIGYLLSLDSMTLELLNEKIADPNINFSEIARRRKTSRQAVQQAVRRKCRENPELARLINNREYIRKQRKQPTFMEAVCQIRQQQQQTSAANWKKPESASNSYKSLNSWNRNFDLSKMSIIKGSSIFPVA